jgi:hypothetical protein
MSPGELPPRPPYDVPDKFLTYITTRIIDDPIIPSSINRPARYRPLNTFTPIPDFQFSSYTPIPMSTTRALADVHDLIDTLMTRVKTLEARLTAIENVICLNPVPTPEPHTVTVTSHRYCQIPITPGMHVDAGSYCGVMYDVPNHGPPHELCFHIRDSVTGGIVSASSIRAATAAAYNAGFKP